MSSTSLAQLILEAAKARAEGMTAQGQIWGGVASSLGQIPNQIIAAKKSSADEALKQKLGQSELTARANDAKLQQDKLDQIAEAKQAEQATSALVSQHTTTDPATGQHTTDHQAVAQGLMAINPKFANQYMADAEARTTHANTIQKQDLEATIAKNKYYADSVLGPLADAKPEDYQTQLGIARGNLAGLGVPPSHPVYAALASTPDQDTVAKLRDQYRGSAATQEAALKAADIKAKGGQADKDAADAAAANARVREIDATLNGTVPIPLAKQEELKIERQKLTETIRENKAKDAAANPFGVPASGAQGSAGTGGARPTGDDFLKTLAPNVASEVKAYAEGRRPFPTGMSYSKLEPLIQLVGQYDPTFDAANYNARNKARMDLTSPSGTGGKTINALNTAVQHAGRLSDLIEKLDNYESPIANAVVNPIRTATGQTEVTNFKAVAPQLAKEIERAWRGAGGSTADIKDLIDSIGSNLGKQQQREALDQFVELLKGKLDSTQQQRDNIMGPAGASIPVLFDQNKPVLEKITQRASGNTPPASVGPKAGETRTYNGETRTWNGIEWVKK